MWSRTTKSFQCILLSMKNKIEPRHEKTGYLPMRKKGADQLRSSAKLIGTFVFSTRIVQFLFFLNPKFQVSRHLLLLYRPICVRPGRKPRRPVFSRRGSWITFVTISVFKHKIPGYKLSRLVGKPTMWFPNRSDTNRNVQSEKMARGLNFWI